jgi:hypothetical protein
MAGYIRRVLWLANQILEAVTNTGAVLRSIFSYGHFTKSQRLSTKHSCSSVFG